LRTMCGSRTGGVWVLSMHSSRGRLRTMSGSRTGGWSLPCVVSD
jgi:hypothetical protein